VPALPPVPGVIKFELLWTQAGIPAANILHAAYTGGPPAAADVAAFCLDLDDAFWVTPFRADYPASTVYVGSRGTDLSSSTGATAEHSVGSAGTATDSGISAQACLMVNYSITRRYRGGHPRTYFPPPAWGGLTSPSDWDSGVVSDCAGAVADIQSVFSTATHGSTTLSGMVCVSYVAAKVPRVDPLVEPITGYSVGAIVRTQRRRLTASSY
jgi:hypothetical protein